MTGLRERKKQETRNAIVTEAGRLFAAQGFGATTMDEIAGAAGVSPATLYNYFGNKNTVLLAHIEATVGEMMAAGAAILEDPPAEPLAGVQALAGVHVDHFIAMERELLREVFAAGFGPSNDVLPELIRLDELLADQFAGLLALYPNGLGPGITVEEAVITIYSLFAGQLVMYVSFERMTPVTLRHAVNRQIEIAFSGLAPRKGNQ